MSRFHAAPRPSHMTTILAAPRSASFASLVLAVIALPGCFDSYRALDHVDAGGSDAGPLADAQPRDAQPRDAQSRDGAGDADTPCQDGIEWLDPVPELRAMDVGVAPSLVASTSGFDLLYQIAGPSPCDGICPWLLRLPTSGAATAHVPAYWAYEVGTASYLAARVDETGQPSFAALVGDELLWVGAPSIASWTIPEGRVTLDDTFGDVVFTADDEVLVETHRAGATSMHVEGSQVLVFTRAGVLDRMIDTHAIFSERFWAPQLGLGPDGTVWVGALQNTLFPATVQLATLDGGPIWTGGPVSGCGTTTFDLAPLWRGETFVIQDCGASSTFSRAGGASVEVTVTSARRTSVASRIAVSGSTVGTAYRDDVGALRVALHTETGTPIATTAVPGAGIVGDDAIAGPIDLAAHADGTFAVVWTRTAAEYPEGAIQRFRACE